MDRKHCPSTNEKRKFMETDREKPAERVSMV
jgi:hypothetical protein